MKATAFLTTDVLDIIFLNRNKDYGAYSLRKEYPQRLLKALLGMIFFATIVCVSFLSKNTNIIKPDVIVDLPGLVNISPDVVKPKTQSQQRNSPANETAPTIVPDVDVDSARVDTNRYVPTSDFGDGTDFTEPGESGGGGGGGNDSLATGSKPDTAKPVVPIVKKDEPINNPDVQPLFPGGMNEFIKYMQKNLKAPDELEAGEEVAVRVKFVVSYDGSLVNFEVVQTGGEIFDKEVIRVLKKMPKWIPGKSNGQEVSVFYTLPVKFTGHSD
jgi:periplasmic protein TonB